MLTLWDSVQDVAVFQVFELRALYTLDSGEKGHYPPPRGGPLKPPFGTRGWACSNSCHGPFRIQDADSQLQKLSMHAADRLDDTSRNAEEPTCPTEPPEVGWGWDLSISMEFPGGLNIYLPSDMEQA